MLIVCAGRGRSGSTLLYNLVRLTLVHVVGKKKVYGRSHRKYRRAHKAKYHVVKIHGHNNYLWDCADHIFSSCRDESDQRKSVRAHRKLNKNILLTDQELDDYIEADYGRCKRWSSHKNFTKLFDFDELVYNKEDVIMYLCELFNLELNDGVDEIILGLENLKSPDKGYDKENCLTKHHYTSSEFMKDE